MKSGLRVVLGIVVSLLATCAVPPVLADQPNISSGAPTGGSNGSSIDTVDLQTGRLLVHMPLPILSPQRGGHLNFEFGLTANSVAWSVQTSPRNHWIPGTNFFQPNNFGVGFTRSWDITFVRQLTVSAHQNSVGATVVTVESEANHYLVTAEGGTHHLQDISSASDGSNWMAIDGSGYQVFLGSKNAYGVYTAGTIVTRDGNRYSLNLGSLLGTNQDPCGDPTSTTTTTLKCTLNSTTTQVEDVNGNLYTLVSAGNGPGEDTKGLTPPSQVAPGPTATCPSGDTVRGIGYLGYGGSTQTITLCYAPVSISTSFAQSGVSDYPATNQSMMAQAIMPDGLKYTYQYDSYGNLSNIGLPQGGSISYTWETVNLGLPTCGNPAQLSRAVQSRTLNDNNGHTYTWHYSYGSVTSSGTLTNTVTDPNSNDTDVVFSQYSTSQAGGVAGATACSGLVQTSTRTYSGTGSSRTLLAQQDIQYQAQAMTADLTSSTDSTPIVGNIYATTVTTTDSVAGKVKQVKRTSDTGLGSSSGKPFFGQPVKEQVYDWGSGSPGSLLKETDTTYLWQNDSRYLSASTLDLPATVIVKDGGGNQNSRTDYSYDGSVNLAATSNIPQHTSAPSAVRGNITYIAQWLNTRPSSAVTKAFNFFDTGERVDDVPPANWNNDHRTEFHYDSTGTYVTETDFPTTNVLPWGTGSSVAHVVKAQYDANTGLVTSATDQNNNVTTFSYDGVGHLTQKNNPDGGEHQFFYNQPSNITGLSETWGKGLVNSTSNLATFNFVSAFDSTYDGLGRTIRVRKLTGNDSVYVNVASTYDAFGRATTVTNPYFSTNDSTYGTTQTHYDPLGRIDRITEPDNSVITTSYSQTKSGVNGICVIEQDEASKQREICSDALGRPAVVFEDPSGLNLETDYAYVTTSNGSTQVTVTQKGRSGTNSGQYRVRTATYDSVGRLLSATNPETGTINYSYDDNGDILTKTDNRNVQVSYTYDQLYRPSLISYNDGKTQNEGLVYDYASLFGVNSTNPVGRLTATTTEGQRWVFYSYDVMGRIIGFNQCPGDSSGQPVSCVTSLATYDFAGDLAQLVYPNLFTVNYTYDVTGWVQTAKDSNGYAYASSVAYAPNGSVTSIQTSNFGYNYAYNNRFQPINITIGNSSHTLLEKDYAYNAGTSDNGNVVSITNDLSSARSEAFGYDSLNRLTCAQAGVTTLGSSCTGTGTWGNSYGYDDFGNLIAKTIAATSGESLSATVNANNKITSYTSAGTSFTPSYDPAGNMTSDGATTYTFDAWNRIIAAGNTTYQYGPSGERWSKNVSGNSYGYFYGASGRLIADYGPTGGSNSVYLGGLRLAQVQYSGAPGSTYNVANWNIFHYYLADLLGTTDQLVNSTGTILTVVDDQDFFPFGGAVSNVGTVANPDPTRFKYTGQERDAETGLDFFGARFYNSTLGRWMSADWSAGPSAIPYADVAAPQSMNLYSYGGNNPTSTRDQDGHVISYIDGQQQGDPFGGGGFGGASQVSGVSDLGNEFNVTSAPEIIAVDPGVCTLCALSTAASNGGTEPDPNIANVWNSANPTQFSCCGVAFQEYAWGGEPGNAITGGSAMEIFGTDQVSQLIRSSIANPEPIPDYENPLNNCDANCRSIFNNSAGAANFLGAATLVVTGIGAGAIAVAATAADAFYAGTVWGTGSEAATELTGAALKVIGAYDGVAGFYDLTIHSGCAVAGVLCDSRELQLIGPPEFTKIFEKE